MTIHHRKKALEQTFRLVSMAITFLIFDFLKHADFVTRYQIKLRNSELEAFKAKDDKAPGTMEEAYQ